MLPEQREVVKNLYKNNAYNEIINICRASYDLQEDDNWTGLYYALSLRKAGDIKASVNLSSRILKKDPEFIQIRNNYLWCLYDRDIKEMSSGFYKSAEIILNKSNMEDKYSPYEIVLKKYLDKIVEDKEYGRAIHLLRGIDINKLSPSKGTGSHNKHKYAMSVREKFCLKFAKILYLAEKYKVCIDIAREALRESQKYQWENAVWIKRYIALSLHKLGRNKEALNFIEEVMKRKRDWFILREKGQILAALDEHDEAIKYLARSISHRLTPDKAILSLKSMYNSLKRKAMRNEASACYKEIEKIENNTCQKLSKEIIDMCSKLSGKTDVNMLKDTKKYRGEIIKVFEHGGAGFIQGEDGRSYYFNSKDIKKSNQELSEGIAATYNLKRSFDKKKNKDSLVAVNIILEN